MNYFSFSLWSTPSTSMVSSWFPDFFRHPGGIFWSLCLAVFESLGSAHEVARLPRGCGWRRRGAEISESLGCSIGFERRKPKHSGGLGDAMGLGWCWWFLPWAVYTKSPRRDSDIDVILGSSQVLLFTESCRKPVLSPGRRSCVWLGLCKRCSACPKPCACCTTSEETIPNVKRCNAWPSPRAWHCVSRFGNLIPFLVLASLSESTIEMFGAGDPARKRTVAMFCMPCLLEPNSKYHFLKQDCVLHLLSRLL